MRIPARFIAVEMVIGLALTLHAGGGGIAAGRYADRIRQNNLDALCFGGLHQPYKGIGPGVAVHINLADVGPTIIRSLKESSPGRQIFHLAGEYIAFGRLRFLIHIVDGTVHLDGRTVCGVCVAHAGKAVEGIAPPGHVRITISHGRDVTAGDIDAVYGCQHTPGVC